MTREERTLSYEIRARELIDPLFRERIQVHLMDARGKLKAALEDITVSPETIDELDYKVRTYGKLLSVALKMDVVEKTKDDAFAEANVTAQEEEVKKLCESSS
jgi:hypothetical protein